VFQGGLAATQYATDFLAQGGGQVLIASDHDEVRAAQQCVRLEVRLDVKFVFVALWLAHLSSLMAAWFWWKITVVIETGAALRDLLRMIEDGPKSKFSR